MPAHVPSRLLANTSMREMLNLRVDREQLVALARATPFAMLGYAVNVMLACVAFWDDIQFTQLSFWVAFALLVCGGVALRAIVRRPHNARSDVGVRKTRDATPALVVSLLLALPWSILAIQWLGTISVTGSIVLIALAVGMGASGSILLAPLPVAAILYASTILIPIAIKFSLLGGRHNLVLAGLTVSFLLFLIGLIRTTSRMFLERLDAVRKTKEACDLAQRATEAKADFFATMSHEIRTPLNSMIGYTSLVLARGNLCDEDSNDLTVARDAGRTLLSVVNDVLDFSALEAGRLKLVRAPTSLRPIIEGCLSLMRVEARRKGLSLTGSIDPILDKTNVYADDQRIRQVLLNLISNAIKFTSSGRVAIEASCLSRSADTLLVRFSVRDSGPGIPAASIPDLFKRFSQLDASRERRFGGSGLGLAICKHIVEANDGTIGVDSEIGVGSTFWFELPLPVIDASPAKKPASEPKILLSKQKHILVVDDIEPNRRLTATVLKTQGHRVTTAASGQEAIARVTSEDYDLILMDVQMPGMSGLTATKTIKELGGRIASIPIIGMTANVFADDIANCHAAGMSGHLGKPFELDELIRCAAAALAIGDTSEPHEDRTGIPHRTAEADPPFAEEKIA